MAMSRLVHAMRVRVFKLNLFVFAFVLLIPSSMIGNSDYFVTPYDVAYSQSDTNNIKPNVTNSTNMLWICRQKKSVLGT